MSSPAEKKDKGKVPARDYSQNKRLPAMGQITVAAIVTIHSNHDKSL